MNGNCFLNKFKESCAAEFCSMKRVESSSNLFNVHGVFFSLPRTRNVCFANKDGFMATGTRWVGNYTTTYSNNIDAMPMNLVVQNDRS